MKAIVTIPGSGRILLSFSLLVLCACGTGPTAATPPTEPGLTVPASTATPSPVASAHAPAPSASVIPPTAFPAATSRGPELEATDPETVRLDAGSLQLIEFFRFT